MTKCLIGLGSNLGDRAATLDAAIEALVGSPGIDSVRQSAWQLTLPVGAKGDQPAYLNGAALVETPREPANLLALLQQTETHFGRERSERWSSRTLDLDLLLCGEAIIDTPVLTVPHPRMSFRRFVLEPAVEIAAGMVHPTVGWTLERLLDQLESGSDCVALVSPNNPDRLEFAATISKKFGLTERDPAVINSPFWPTDSTTWLAVPGGDPSPRQPKLSILLEADSVSEKERGPTLRIGRMSEN